MTQTPALNDSSFLPDVDPMFEHYLVDEPRLTYESPDDGPLTRTFVRLLEGFLGRQKMEAHYQSLKGRKTDAKTFFREAFKLTNITIDGDMASKIRLMVVMNFMTLSRMLMLLARLLLLVSQQLLLHQCLRVLLPHPSRKSLLMMFL